MKTLHHLLPLIAALALGCGQDGSSSTGTGGSDGSSTQDSGGGPDDPADTGFCAEVPVVTWDNWGEGFLIERCQACHASTSENRNDAPEEVVFDTREETLAQADRILARAAGEDATMPPEGGVTDDDKFLLTVWLTCWEGP